MNLGVANGKIFLLYQHSEEANVRKMRKQLAAEGVIPIPCEDPKNFRFVTPEAVPTERLNLIGRLALKNLGSYQCTDFVKDLKAELARNQGQ